jgi:ABC-type multidrug transport system ATPase subunit
MGKWLIVNSCLCSFVLQFFAVLPVVETRLLNKSFKQFQAVSDLSFSINKGEIYGFLGQNGAGKSTVMRMLTGLIYPDSGTILINGAPFSNRARHLLSCTSAIIERPDMYGYLSGWDNLKIYSAFNTAKATQARLWEVLDIVGLRGREKDLVKAYSQGMKQRLAIAIALVSKPELLILDEPTNGLDPQGIADMRRLILQLNQAFNTTVLISSHLLYEIQQVASHMVVLHKGKKIVEGALSKLLNPDDTLTEVTVGSAEHLNQQLQQSQWAQHYTGVEAGKLIFKMNPAMLPELNRWLVGENIDVLGIASRHSLEAYFLSLTDDAATKNGII